MKKIEMRYLLEDKPTADSRERISDFKLYLEQINPAYKKILTEMSKIKKENPKIEKLYDGEEIELSKNDCKALQKIIDLQYQKIVIEEHSIENLGMGTLLNKLSMVQAFIKFRDEKKKGK